MVYVLFFLDREPGNLELWHSVPIRTLLFPTSGGIVRWVEINAVLCPVPRAKKKILFHFPEWESSPEPVAFIVSLLCSCATKSKIVETNLSIFYNIMTENRKKCLIIVYKRTYFRFSALLDKMWHWILPLNTQFLLAAYLIHHFKLKCENKR